jgi:membrane protease subunit HflK
MTWNEPGNSGNKDPWGNRKNQDGPPDLDELVKKLQSRIGGIFGGKRGGGGGGSSDGSNSIFSLVALGAVVLWAVSGFYVIKEGTVGVITQLGAYHETTDPGFHWYPRLLQKLEVVNVKNVGEIHLGVTGQGNFIMLTKDENLVDIKISVQYQIKNPKNYLFNIDKPVETLRDAAESAVREVVGKRHMEVVITEGRSEVAASVKNLIQATMDNYGSGMLVTSVNLNDANPPHQVKDAFEDVVKAREDREKLKNQAEAYSNDILPKARGAAARQVEDAKAYKEQVISQAEGEAARFIAILEEYRKAPRVTRERLYLETMEYIMANSNKIVVDVKGGNSMFYVPLEQFLKQRGIQTPQQNNTAPQNNSSSSQRQDSTTTDTNSRDYLRERGTR